MRARFSAIAIAALCGCSRSPAPAQHARVAVALTIDWEGAYLSSDGLDAIDELRNRLGNPPLTHFVCAAYFAKQHPDPTVIDTLQAAIKRGDELAVHLHAWRSLATAAAIEPKLAPSFLTGTNQLLPFDDGDSGFDTDLDAYDVPGLRAMLRASKRLLEQAHLPIAKTFRAGGYLATPKVREAIRAEGYAIDSSATDAHAVNVVDDDFLPSRLAQLWPNVDAATAPFPIATPDGELFELPIAAIADYVTADRITEVVRAAHARLAGRDVVVVLAFHQENAAEFAKRLADGLAPVTRDLGDDLTFVTIDQAAALARP